MTNTSKTHYTENFLSHFCGIAQDKNTGLLIQLLQLGLIQVNKTFNKFLFSKNGEEEEEKEEEEEEKPFSQGNNQLPVKQTQNWGI